MIEYAARKAQYTPLRRPNWGAASTTGGQPMSGAPHGPFDRSPPLLRLSGPSAPVVQRVQVAIGDSKKEILSLSEKEMEQLMMAQPMLTEDMEQEIEQWFTKQQLAHTRERYFRGMLQKWKSGDEPYEAKPRKKRKAKSQAVEVNLYSDEDSDYGEPEFDFDQMHEKYPFSTTAAINRSHVPTEGDELGQDVPITSLHHADTFLMVTQGGHFIPRTINGKPNVKAHRKRLPEKKLKQLARKRDNLKLEEEERDEAKEHLKTAQKQILFGNAIDWSEGEYDKKLVEKQEQLRKKLKTDQTPVGDLIRRNAMKGLRSGAKSKTSTDAEQKLLASKVWRGMLTKLHDKIKTVKQRMDEQVNLTPLGIKILINRSSCLGCSKVLALGLIDFWTDVAGNLGLKDWREAKDFYAPRRLFTLAFPVAYEYDEEKSSDFKNLSVILEGLRDAGWEIEVPKGIESNDHAEQNHQKLKGLLSGKK